MPRTLAILTYHSIDESGSLISISSARFRRQMTALAQAGYRTIPLTEVVHRLRARVEFQPKTIAMTFDDGFENFYTTAYPVLCELGFGATVFLVSGRSGKDNRWPGQMQQVPSLKLLSWSQVAEMAKGGIEFGAHTVTHPDLSTLSMADAKEEIVASKRMIEDHTGKEVEAFAYPYGKYSQRVSEVVRQTFVAACSVDLDWVGPTSDPHCLPRIDMYYLAKLDRVGDLDQPLLRSYLSVRKLMRGVRGSA